MLLGLAADGDFLDLDKGWPPLVKALADENIGAEVAWDDPAVDWGRYDGVTVMYA